MTGQIVKANFASAILMNVYCWWIFSPLAFVASLLWLPFKVLGKLIFGSPAEPKEANQIDLKIIESKQKVPKDDILLIHGFPDCGRMWDK